MTRYLFHHAMATAFGALFGWFFAALLVLITGDFMGDATGMILLGALVTGGAALALSLASRLVLGGSQSAAPREAIVVLLLGLVLGGGVGALTPWLHQALMNGLGLSRLVARIPALLCLGLVIGLVAGINLERFSVRQMLVTSAGGVLGSLVGAVLYLLVHQLLGGLPEQTLACIEVTLAAILVGLFSAILPHLRRDGSVRLIDTDHPLTRRKLLDYTWVILRKQQSVIGSSPKLSRAPDIQLFDEDRVSPRHAIVRDGAKGGFELLSHPDRRASDTLTVEGRPVGNNPVPLEQGMRISVGGSVLRFEAGKADDKAKHPSPSAAAPPPSRRSSSSKRS